MALFISEESSISGHSPRLWNLKIMKIIILCLFYELTKNSYHMIYMKITHSQDTTGSVNSYTLLVKEIFLWFESKSIVHFSNHSISIKRWNNELFYLQPMNGCKFEWLENGLYVWFFVLNVRSLNIWKMLNCSKNVLYVWFQNIEKYYYVEPL